MTSEHSETNMTTGMNEDVSPIPLVKFCGLCRPQDVEAANRLCPDFAGFIMCYPPSPRNLSIETMHAIGRFLNPGIRKVGVFVDQDPQLIAQAASACSLKYVQLHGNETEDDIQRLRELGAPRIIKAFVIRDEADVQRAQNSSADYVLLDNGKGTGEQFDWSLIGKIDRPYFLSGGITIDNIDEALTLHPFAIDVSSGIETNGRKDEAKMEALLAAVRGA